MVTRSQRKANRSTPEPPPREKRGRRRWRGGWGVRWARQTKTCSVFEAEHHASADTKSIFCLQKFDFTTVQSHLAYRHSVYRTTHEKRLAATADGSIEITKSSTSNVVVTRTTKKRPSRLDQVAFQTPTPFAAAVQHSLSPPVQASSQVGGVTLSTEAASTTSKKTGLHKGATSTTVVWWHALLCAALGTSPLTDKWQQLRASWTATDSTHLDCTTPSLGLATSTSVRYVWRAPTVKTDMKVFWVDKLI